MQPDTLFVEFNQTPSAELANAPAASDPAGLPLPAAAHALEEAEEDAQHPRIQRKEAGRATRAAAPPVAAAPRQAAAAARAVGEEDGPAVLPDLHGDVPRVVAAPRGGEVAGESLGSGAAAQTR